MKQREALTMVAQLKFKLMLLGLVCTMIYSPFVLADLEVVEWVQRRQSGDFYSYVEQLTIEHDRCPRNASSSDTTFMINQRECVEDQQLYAECRYAILASSSPLIAVVFNINSDPLSVKHLVTNDREVAETFYFNRSDKLLLNSSFCHIASLEVVRGREQAIQINHSGFSLGDNATIEINPAKLMYSLEEYQGELYRLNISCNCTTSDLPQTGCLYFKVVGQNSRSNVTYAKFNCTVPGTLTDFNDECNVTNVANTSEEDQVSETQTQTENMSTPSTTTFNSMPDTNSTENPPVDEDSMNNFTLVGVLITIVVGIVILTFLIIILCPVLQYKRTCAKMQSYSIEMVEQCENLSPDRVHQSQNGNQHQQQCNEPIDTQRENPIPEITADSGHNIMDNQFEIETNLPTTTNANDCTTAPTPSEWVTNEETGHVYAVLEQTISLEKTTGNNDQETMSTTLSQPQDSTTASLQSQDKPLSVSTAIPPPKSGLQISLKDMLVQIYDEVSPKDLQSNRKTADQELLYANVSHPPKKISLPTYLRTVKQDESFPIYTIPDTRKQREERSRGKQPTARKHSLGSSRKISTTSCPPHLNVKGTAIRAESAHLQEPPPPEWLTDEKTGHVYAVLEQTIPPEKTTSNIDQEKTMSTTSQPQDRTAASLQSQEEPLSVSLSILPPKSGLQFPLRDMLVQIYDEVSPKDLQSKGKTADQESLYANVSHPRKKISLPTYLRTEKQDPIYSIPDTRKQREERSKGKQKTVRKHSLGSSRKISTISCPPHLNVKSTAIHAESARHQQTTYCNLNKVKQVLLEEDYDSPDILGHGQELGQGLGQGLGPGLGQELGQGLGQELGQGLGQELGQGLGQELGQRLGQGLGQELGQGLGQGLGDELGKGLGQRLSGEDKDMDRAEYDNPSSLDLIPKRERKATIELT